MRTPDVMKRSSAVIRPASFSLARAMPLRTEDARVVAPALAPADLEAARAAEAALPALAYAAAALTGAEASSGATAAEAGLAVRARMTAVAAGARPRRVRLAAS